MAAVPDAPRGTVSRTGSQTSCTPTRTGPTSTGTTGCRTGTAYAELFFSELLAEPHSTKQHEDCVGWAADAGARNRAAATRKRRCPPPVEAQTEAILDRVSCPVLAIHGRADRSSRGSCSAQLAELTGGELLMLEGAGHLPQAREPVVINHAIRDFAVRFRPPSSPRPERTWTRPSNRPRRVLYMSSPIGLGHARRDMAIADELRALRPGLEVHWLAQHPVTELLRRRSELIHPPRSSWPASPAISRARPASMTCTRSRRSGRMDEILVSNFMVFSDLVEREHFDLWVGDEAWDVDYFLHENPELKRAPYAWLTDFVGWLPMRDGGVRERTLTRDYNAEMIEQIARFPSLRDRACFVGNPRDVVPDRVRRRAAAHR